MVNRKHLNSRWWDKPQMHSLSKFWAPGDRIMDSSISVSHLLKHMLPFLLSNKRNSGNMAISIVIKEHYKYEDGTMILLSFYLL